MSPATAQKVNATAAALLALLHSGPMTGGQLVAAAGEQYGGFFSVTRSQVYRELPALTDVGLLRRGKQGARSSQQYAITAAGRRAFHAWVAEGGGTDPVRSPLVLRLLHADLLDRGERDALVTSGKKAYEERLRDEQAVVDAAEDQVQRAVAEFAVAHTEAMLALLDAIPTGGG